MYKNINILFLIFYPLTIFSQFDTIPYSNTYKSISFQFHKGFIIPHSESIRSISYSKPWTIEGDFSWHFNTIKAWSYCSCFPRIGISVMYINYDNQAILGNGYAVLPYVEPFFSAHKKINTSFRFAAGVAYLDNVYNSDSNPLNLFYSTHFSYLLSGAFKVNYRFLNNWNVHLAANYNHISNGGNKEPNKGINFPTLSLGVDHYFRPATFQKFNFILADSLKKKSEVRLGIIGGAKRPFLGEGSRYPLYGFTGNYSYLVGRISAIICGAEFINDQSLPESLKRTSTDIPDHKRAALLAGHELRIGRFRFSQQLGVYIYSPLKARDPVYQRWGLEFVVFRRFFVGVNLKAHRHVADFMDVRVGVIPGF